MRSAFFSWMMTRCCAPLWPNSLRLTVITNPIGDDIVQLLNGVSEANTAREPWQAGDLMLVDNIRSAHSREAFSGPREVLVAMAAPVRVTDTPQTPR